MYVTKYFISYYFKSFDLLILALVACFASYRFLKLVVEVYYNSERIKQHFNETLFYRYLVRIKIKAVYYPI